jgi:hypothetical protein
VDELCKELCQKNRAITLMTAENWTTGCKTYLYKNLGLHFKISCMSTKTMQRNEDQFDLWLGNVRNAQVHDSL